MLKQNDFNKHQEIIDKSSYFMSDGELDRERLNIVNEIYNSKTFGFLIKHGLKAGTHVLEIGCGYGHCAIWMAQQVAKNGGSVTAIDFSEETLDIAKQNAINAGVFNIEFICFDISLISNLKTKVPIDFVYGRWVIEFCKLSPDKVLQDLYTLLSPGGIFTYETGNFINNGIRGEPENILINRWQALCLANAMSRGNELNMARRIPNDLETLGYTKIQIEKNYPILSTSRHKSVFRLGLLSVQEGVITNKIMNINKSDMEQFIFDCKDFEADKTKQAKFFDVTFISAIKAL